MYSTQYQYMTSWYFLKYMAVVYWQISRDFIAHSNKNMTAALKGGGVSSHICRAFLLLSCLAPGLESSASVALRERCAHTVLVGLLYWWKWLCCFGCMWCLFFTMMLNVVYLFWYLCIMKLKKENIVAI